MVETTEEEYIFSLEDLDKLLLKFSHKGKPLREDGPVHILKKMEQILMLRSNLSQHSV